MPSNKNITAKNAVSSVNKITSPIRFAIADVIMPSILKSCATVISPARTFSAKNPVNEMYDATVQRKPDAESAVITLILSSRSL